MDRRTMMTTLAGGVVATGLVAVRSNTVSAAEGKLPVATAAPVTPPSVPGGGGERIVVVDDEPEVRAFAIRDGVASEVELSIEPDS